MSDPVTTFSPSRRYRLVVSQVETRPGCWNYSKGVVTCVASHHVLAVVERNYSHFPATWIDGHANGHDYLVCGADYQGQTVIELDTITEAADCLALRKDFLPEEAKEGCGFCWTSHRYDPTQQMLIVTGCVWACTYEYRFYDFSDPMSGWPAITALDLKGEWVGFEISDKWPEVNGNLVKVFETDPTWLDDDSDDRENEPPVAIATFQRQGDKLQQLSYWVDPEEHKRRDVRDAKQKAYDDALALYKRTDPIWLKVMECLKANVTPTAKPEYWYFTGTTYKGWCPTFDGTEPRIGLDGVKIGNAVFEIDWGRVTAPVRLSERDKKDAQAHFFPHSPEGVTAAFELAKRIGAQA